MRLENVVGPNIPAEQAIFRRDFSTTNHVMSIKLLLEECRKWDQPLHMIFVDFKKTFDTIELKSMGKN